MIQKINGRSEKLAWFQHYFVHNLISDCVLDLQEVPNGLNQLACEFQGLVPGEKVEIAGHVLVFIAHLGNHL